MVESQFRKTEWVSFSERIVAQSCDLILDSWDYWQPVKLLKEGLMCSCLRDLKTSLAAEFRIFWGLSKRCFGKPDRREVQLSSFDKTKAHMRVFISSKIR